VNEKFVSFKLGSRHLDALRAVDANVSTALRRLAHEWSAAMPTLPADDVRRVGRAGGGRLRGMNQRMGDSLRHVLTLAGDGNLSAGVRRLALWSAQRQAVTP